MKQKLFVTFIALLAFLTGGLTFYGVWQHTVDSAQLPVGTYQFITLYQSVGKYHPSDKGIIDIRADGSLSVRYITRGVSGTGTWWHSQNGQLQYVVTDIDPHGTVTTTSVYLVTLVENGKYTSEGKLITYSHGTIASSTRTASIILPH